jgi:hypothetical protein
VPTLVDEGAILNILGPSAGDAALTAIEAASTAAGAYESILARVVRILHLGNDGLDLGNSETQAMLSALQTAGVLTSAQVSALLAAATTPQVVLASDVSRVWAQYRPNGVITGTPS